MVLRLASTSSTRWQLIPSGTAVTPRGSSCPSNESDLLQFLQDFSSLVGSGEGLAEPSPGDKKFDTFLSPQGFRPFNFVLVFLILNSQVVDNTVSNNDVLAF